MQYILLFYFLYYIIFLVIMLKIKEIRLETVKVFKNKEEIYYGKVEDAPIEILESNVSEIHFEPAFLSINI